MEPTWKGFGGRMKHGFRLTFQKDLDDKEKCCPQHFTGLLSPLSIHRPGMKNSNDLCLLTMFNSQRHHLHLNGFNDGE